MPNKYYVFYYANELDGEKVAGCVYAITDDVNKVYNHVFGYENDTFYYSDREDFIRFIDEYLRLYGKIRFYAADDEDNSFFLDYDYIKIL